MRLFEHGLEVLKVIIMRFTLLANTPAVSDVGAVELRLAELLVDLVMHGAHPTGQKRPSGDIGGVLAHDFAERLRTRCTRVQMRKVAQKSLNTTLFFRRWILRVRRCKRVKKCPRCSTERLWINCSFRRHGVGQAETWTGLSSRAWNGGAWNKSFAHICSVRITHFNFSRATMDK